MPRIEVAYVRSKDLRRITLGIHCDEDHLERVAVAPKQLLYPPHLGQRVGTYVGALGESEEHRDDAASKILQRALLAGLVRQREVTCVVRSCDVNAPELAIGPR